MDKHEEALLEHLRETLFRGIEAALEMDSHSKYVDGSVAIRYPDFWMRRKGAEIYTVEICCYVLGPARHYEWHGKTIFQALSKALVDVINWVKELDDV